MRYLVLAPLLCMLQACGPMQALTREYYKPPAPIAGQVYATVTGSDTGKADGVNRIRAYVGGVDGKSVSLPKTARCNFNKLYTISPGARAIGLSLTIGRAYTESVVAYEEVLLVAEEGKHYVAKGDKLDSTKATVWIEEVATGRQVTVRHEIQLRDNPQKRMPMGFAVIEDAC